MDPLDLSPWVKQGVFLANAYLTVRAGVPGSHDFWRPFTEYWINKLVDEYDDIIWLMWGRKAQEYIPLIKANDTHTIIKTSHPSPMSFMSSSADSPAFLGSKCFEKVNNQLWVNKDDMIQW